jgi:hypothetical protein
MQILEVGIGSDGILEVVSSEKVVNQAKLYYAHTILLLLFGCLLKSKDPLIYSILSKYVSAC